MTGGRVNYGAIMAMLLVAVIVACSLAIGLRYSRSQAVQISVVPQRAPTGEITVGGEVSNPGLYPWREGDTLADIIRAAGGLTAEADPGRLLLKVPREQEGEPPQKVNINRAEAWLLAALPGIGEARAQSIIQYREQNGPFHDINELLKVAGIGTAAYERIKPLITVTD